MTISYLSIAVTAGVAAICGLVIVWVARQKSRGPQSTDDFIKAMLKRTAKTNKDLAIKNKFGEYEATLLRRCFYDERLKVRRSEVPKFFVYSVLCESEPIRFWSQEIGRIEVALLNLQSIEYIASAAVPEFLSNYVGPAARTYKLTAEGLEVLQSWHPNVALQIKAWIRVMPAWAVLTGSVCGAIGAVWKASEVASQLLTKLHWF